MRLALILAFLPLIAFAQERPPLHDDPELETGLRKVAQAHLLRSSCESVSLRVFRGLGLLNRLKSRARALGYSNDEMQTYFDDPVEKQRVESLALADLVALGADFDHAETVCSVAQEVIASGKGVGWYLKM